MREKFSIRLISKNEIPEVTNWARLEGFSPGMDDVLIYRCLLNEIYHKFSSYFYELY